MSPLASTLLYASRYSHGRSLHPYEHVIAAAREVWPLLEPSDRKYLLAIWEEQTPGDMRPFMRGDFVYSADEAAKELADWLRLFAELRGMP